MADEGGASAALMEIDDDFERRRLHKALGHRERRQKQTMIALGIVSASLILGAGAWLIASSRRRGLRWSDIVGVRARLDWS